MCQHGFKDPPAGVDRSRTNDDRFFFFVHFQSGANRAELVWQKGLFLCLQFFNSF